MSAQFCIFDIKDENEANGKRKRFTSTQVILYFIENVISVKFAKN